jgi:transcriptional regulator with XRE-family HTH domain
MFPEILELRKRFGLSQDRMAELLGIKNCQLISQWETGRGEPRQSMRLLVNAILRLSGEDANAFFCAIDPRMHDPNYFATLTEKTRKRRMYWK